MDEVYQTLQNHLEYVFKSGGITAPNGSGGLYSFTFAGYISEFFDILYSQEGIDGEDVLISDDTIMEEILTSFKYMDMSMVFRGLESQYSIEQVKDFIEAIGFHFSQEAKEMDESYNRDRILSVIVSSLPHYTSPEDGLLPYMPFIVDTLIVNDCNPIGDAFLVGWKGEIFIMGHPYYGEH